MNVVNQHAAVPAAREEEERKGGGQERRQSVIVRHVLKLTQTEGVSVLLTFRAVAASTAALKLILRSLKRRILADNVFAPRSPATLQRKLSPAACICDLVIVTNQSS